jgi:hypothetical protein
MTPVEDQLMFLSKSPEKVRAAAGAMLRASLRRAPEQERAAFLVLLGHLEDMARAIDQLPQALTRHEPGFPWRELSRLPGLLSRSDVRADAKVLRRTLEWPMHHLRPAALRLNTYMSFYPGWASDGQETADESEE